MMLISSIRQRSHFLLVLGVALFLFNGIFQPLFSFSQHNLTYSGEQELYRCGSDFYCNSPYSDVAFAWRNDDLSDFNRKIFAIIPPDSIDFELRISEQTQYCTEVEQGLGLKIDQLFLARAPPIA